MTDAAVVIVVVPAALLVRFGSDVFEYGAGIWLFAGGLVIAWKCALRTGQSYDRRIFGSGSQEYSRVATACFAVFGLLAIVDLLFQLGVARGFIAFALPVGTLCVAALTVVVAKVVVPTEENDRCQDGQGSRRRQRDIGDELGAPTYQYSDLGYDVVGISVPSDRRPTTLR